MQQFAPPYVGERRPAVAIYARKKQKPGAQQEKGKNQLATATPSLGHKRAAASKE